jgi:hypothetical protein
MKCSYGLYNFSESEMVDCVWGGLVEEVELL